MYLSYISDTCEVLKVIRLPEPIRIFLQSSWRWQRLAVICEYRAGEEASSEEL